MRLSSGAEPAVDDGPGDIVQFGRPLRPRWRWSGSLLLTCLVAAAVVLVVTRSASHGRPTAPPVTVTDVGHPILGVRGSWQLFGLDSSGLVTVEFARAQITRTTISLHTYGDGSYSLVPARGEVVVRPLDNVPGYVVPDGEPARRLTGILAHGGILLPGPTPTEQWLDVGATIALVGPAGKPIPARLAEQVQMYPPQTTISDGRGGLLLAGPPGTLYDISPGRVLPIDTGLLLAVGPRNWLGLRCDTGACRDVVISAATGASSALPGAAVSATPWPWQALPGVVSPDGSTAAVIVASQSQNRAWLELISLSSGASMRVFVPVTMRSTSQALAWSPDNRWLFVVTASGQLAAVDPHTGRAQTLHLGLSGLTQIAIRSASR